MTDEELEKIIRAATPGPWHRGEGWEQSDPGYFIYADKPRPVGGGNIVLSEDTAPRLADADFIAAFNPVIALLLLERVRKAEAKVKHLRLVGTGLANAAYNLKQQDYIPEEHRRSLDERQRAWDSVLAGGATPTTSPARRPSPSSDPVDMARRDALVSALRLAEDVEREEKEGGRTDSASGAEEVKDRIKDRIRWLDEVRAALDAGGWVR